MSLDSLDFSRAEFGVTSPSEDCLWCTRALDGSWYTAEDARICSTCAVNVRAILDGGSPKVYWRSFAFGATTAVMCGLVFVAFFHLTGGSWAIFACWGIGYCIGKMMRLGSHGIGGRRYQITAALFTYAAITIGTGAVVLAAAHPPVWLYALFLLSPVLLLVMGKASFAALQILFLFAGIRWAWVLTAGSKLKLKGPFQADVTR